MESWNSLVFSESGLDQTFVQDNHSHSYKNVLRGLHYQIRQPQGKLVRVLSGKVFDVTVDLRKSSAHFGRWVSHELSAENASMLWIPPGFGHGFLVLSDTADFLYKTSTHYAPQWERGIRWDDPTLGIRWPIEAAPLLSDRDSAHPFLKDAEVYL